MKLHVDGPFIKDENNKIVVLKGVNIADPQMLNTKPHERPGVSALSVARKAVEEYKANVVRLPIHPGSGNYPNEGWFNTTDSYFKNHLDPVVQYLTSKRVYSIIDLHYVSDYNGLFSKVKQFWDYMIPKYKDNPFVIFEIFNEPINPDSWSTWKQQIAAPICNLISILAPEKLILCGGPGWSSHMNGALTDPIQPSNKNVAYVIHVYPNQKQDAWRRNWSQILGKLPVFCSEYGWASSGGGPWTGGTVSGFGKPFNDLLDKYAISRTAWIFDCKWQPSMFTKEWSLKVGENEMGGFVRDQMQSNTFPGPTPTPTPTPNWPLTSMFEVNQIFKPDGNGKIQSILKGHFNSRSSAQKFVDGYNTVPDSMYGITEVLLK